MPDPREGECDVRRVNHRSAWQIEGSGYLSEVSILGVWFYARTEFQQWSPVMAEITQHRGVRIGSVTLGWSWTVRKFKDGKQPEIKRGSHLCSL